LERRITLAGIVQGGNIEFAKADFKERIQLVEASFKTVLDSDMHHDDKAGRILSAMAFLTAAAAGIFSVAYNPGSSTTLKQTLTQILLPYVSTAQLPSAVNSVAEGLQKPSLTIFGLSTPVLAFSAYIFFVLVGVALYLGALGPSFNRPSWYRRRSQEVYSVLFFQNIGALKEEAWSDYWLNGQNTLAQLQDQMVKNYIDECRLIAQKLQAKVTLMSLGSLSFRVAILFLVILMAALFSPNTGIVWLVLLLGLTGLFFSFTFVSRILPRQEPQQPQQPQQKSRWQTVFSAITTSLPLGLKSNTQKLPWWTVFLARLTILSLISFFVLFVIKLIFR
jgi:hypothetical protein